MSDTPAPLHETLDFSDKQRVFVSGDIHGEYGMLEDALASHHFDSDKDVLVCAGDLVDRGPFSAAALDWIDRPYVFRVLGNHDIMPRYYLDDIWSGADIERCGGKWFLDQSQQDKESITIRLENAPIAVTIITPKQHRVGVVHADCLSDWESHVTQLDRSWVYDLSIWSRELIKNLFKSQENKIPFDLERVRVQGIDHVFHGHSVLAAPFTLANRSWIDTGACFGGKLSVIDVDIWLEKHHGL